MPHLSELHGAATHLAVVAIPLFAVLHFLRRAGRGATGLLVWGQAQTTLAWSSRATSAGG
jgi:hypothetical protein